MPNVSWSSELRSFHSIDPVSKAKYCYNRTHTNCAPRRRVFCSFRSPHARFYQFLFLLFFSTHKRLSYLSIEYSSFCQTSFSSSKGLHPPSPPSWILFILNERLHCSETFLFIPPSPDARKVDCLRAKREKNFLLLLTHSIVCTRWWKSRRSFDTRKWFYDDVQKKP